MTEERFRLKERGVTAPLWQLSEPRIVSVLDKNKVCDTVVIGAGITVFQQLWPLLTDKKLLS